MGTGHFLKSRTMGASDRGGYVRSGVLGYDLCGGQAAYNFFYLELKPCGLPPM